MIFKISRTSKNTCHVLNHNSRCEPNHTNRILVIEVLRAMLLHLTKHDISREEFPLRNIKQPEYMRKQFSAIEMGYITLFNNFYKQHHPSINQLRDVKYQLHSRGRQRTISYEDSKAMRNPKNDRMIKRKEETNFSKVMKPQRAHSNSLIKRKNSNALPVVFMHFALTVIMKLNQSIYS